MIQTGSFSRSPAAASSQPTQTLPLRSRKTERRRRKLEKQAKRAAAVAASRGFLDLPYELLMAILSFLRPSDIFILSRVNKQLRSFILAEQAGISKHVIGLRYSVLARCLLRPVLMRDVDPAFHPLLRDPGRPDIRQSRRAARQNIPPPDSSLVCTCLTCLLRWDVLCAVVDFAHWQDNLDKGEPIPTIPHGTFPRWNQELLSRNAGIVARAVTSPLWYARVLEAHLDSTTRSIRRHSQNKADRRPHFRMTDEDARSGTDAFLERKGPPTLDYLFSRDSFYLLEVLLPGRSWIAEQQKWVYLPDGNQSHEMDLELVVQSAATRHAGTDPPAAAKPDSKTIQ